MPHYYKRDGTPCHFQLKKDGITWRDTHVGDARDQQLVPSVSEIIRMAASPPLEAWKEEQNRLSALTLPRYPDEPEAKWMERVIADAKETGRKAAERGTAIHDAIERGFSGALLEGDEALHYSGAMRAVEDTFGYQPWISEESFACSLGYGGRVDLHCPTAVVDFKTTEKYPLETLKTWSNHAQQIAAYAYGLGLPLRGAICYVSVTHPGESVCIPISEKELQKGWDCFKALLAYWQAKNDYDSSWE